MKRSIWENAFPITAAVFTAVVLIGHAASCLKIPVEGFCFNDFPVMKYYMESARQFHAESGTLWGYDPHFMAGYPLGFIWNSNIVLQRIAVMFGNLTIETLVKTIFFSGILIFPLAWWVAIRTFGLNRVESSGSFVLGGLYFLAGLPVMFFYVGMMTAGALIYFSLLSAAFLYRYVEDGGLWLIGAALFTPVALYVHKTAGIILFPVWCAALFMCVKRRAFLHVGGMAMVAFVTVVLNWEWIGVLLLYSDMVQAVPEAPFWRNTELLLPLKEYFTGVAVMNNLELDGLRGAVHSVSISIIMILGISGTLTWWRRGERGRVFMLSIPAAVLWLFSYYGGLIPGAGELNPTRYLSVANMMLAVPGGTALAEMIKKSGRFRAAGVSLAILILITAMGSLAYLSEWYRPVHILLSRTEAPEIEALAERIRSLPEGRIMIEDSGAMDNESSGQIYGNSHVLSNFGLRTKKEFIGGPYPYIFLKYHYASFQDSRAFGRRLSDISPAEMRDKMKLYDVKWVICWSEASRKYFERYGGYFQQVEEFGPFEIFELLKYESTLLIKGEAEVSAKYGRIDVEDVHPEGGEIILKYHWPKRFRTEPEIEVSKHEAGGDPIGFIKVTNPPREFTIFIP